jgi:hypothetical protein
LHAETAWLLIKSLLMAGDSEIGLSINLLLNGWLYWVADVMSGSAKQSLLLIGDV